LLFLLGHLAVQRDDLHHTVFVLGQRLAIVNEKWLTSCMGKQGGGI
jgi:hypothetical protein